MYKLAGGTGFEPVHGGIKIRCLTGLGEPPTMLVNISMKLQQAKKMIQDQLALVDHTGETKTQQLIWELGFLMGMLADELKNDYILECNLKNRIQMVIDQKNQSA